MTPRFWYAYTAFVLLVITVGWHWWVGQPISELPYRIAFVTAGVLLVRWIIHGTIRF
jgi:hypothetical protein